MGTVPPFFFPPLPHTRVCHTRVFPTALFPPTLVDMLICLSRPPLPIHTCPIYFFSNLSCSSSLSHYENVRIKSRQEEGGNLKKRTKAIFSLEERLLFKKKRKKSISTGKLMKRLYLFSVVGFAVFPNLAVFTLVGNQSSAPSSRNGELVLFFTFSFLFTLSSRKTPVSVTISIFTVFISFLRRGGVGIEAA